MDNNIPINRCIAITKNYKKCRAITKNNNLFCCDNHLPINKEIINDGCFICMEKITKSNELIYFNCKHVFHKPCYNEWLLYSTYETSICLICRNDSSNYRKCNKDIKHRKKIQNINPLIKLNNILMYLK